jgi:phosphate transport system protein
MQRHFDQDLTELKERLLTMASHAETSVVLATKALSTRQDKVAKEVIANDSILDQFETEIDLLCIDLLALKGPVATDLRLITVAMKVSQNLERIGDEATSMARRVLELNQNPPLQFTAQLPPMTDMAVEMLKGALDALVSGDTERARDIVLRDREVDQYNRQIHQELIACMVADATTIIRCLHLMVFAKCLERIADHATNIAEEVVYLFEARDIRHKAKNAKSGASEPAQT